MLRLVVIFAAAILALLPLYSQTLPSQNEAPSVIVSLPPEVASETVDIRYFLEGKFGGHGGFVKPQPHLHAYELPASVDGTAAASIKVVAYAPGCRFQTFKLEASEMSHVEAKFVCETLPTVTLTGEIKGAPPLNEDTELMVHYLGFWIRGFFGIEDGFVPEFQVATAPLDPSGKFQVAVPNFALDSILSYNRAASLALEIRDRKTLNPIVPNLVPELAKYRSGYGGLRILSSYPDEIRFVSPPHR